MTKAERNPPCPACAAKPVPALTAPSLNRGAVEDTRIKIPENKTKRIDFAQRVIAEDHNVTNLRTGTKPGDIVAPSVAKPQEQAKWGANAGAASARQVVNFGTAAAVGATDPYRDRNSSMIAAMADRVRPNMRPVERKK